jgi:UDP-N-acetylglucosamine/UDP-N-acetylgalactosamine diphosphorylase
MMQQERTMHKSGEGEEIWFDEQGNRERVARLRNAGVLVSSCERVFVGAEVPLEHIEPEAMLVNAMIRGEQTAIGSQAKIGVSGTSVLRNTQVGRGAELGAGWYEQATLLADVKVRGFAELRQGTVLEETAEAGHNVGLKHTFFGVGAVAGSCINFCDVLVTGGSSRQDHTEIGSGAVHFNFDPRGDKFGSLLGDVTGLLLRKRRIFVGGNCGVVAPVQIGFGAVMAAGTTLRKDVEANQMFLGEASDPEATGGEFDPEIYHDLRRKLLTTARLVGNLQALELWYKTVRLPSADGLERMLCEGALRNIRIHLEHRARELDKILSKPALAREDTGDNPFAKQHHTLAKNRQKIFDTLTQAARSVPPSDFVRHYVDARHGSEHCTAIRELPQKLATEAEDWLMKTASQPCSELSTLLE